METKSENLISVIMPTYNTPHHMLKDAIDSILSQTYHNFEFIIVDDCSTDDSYEFISSYNDERIIIIKNEKNIGITASLNVALRAAKGKYIARMDSDDISLPERLQKQYDFMEENHNVIVCGCWYEMFGANHGIVKKIIPSKEYLSCYYLFGNTFGICHPSAFFRADILRDNNIFYNENLPTAQDYGMWTECVKYGDIVNLNSVLLKYRVHDSQISTLKRNLQMDCAMRVQRKLLTPLIGYEDDNLVKKHFEICKNNNITKQTKIWFKRLIELNNSADVYDKIIFKNVINSILKNKIINTAKNVSGLSQLISLLKVVSISHYHVITKVLLFRLCHRSFGVK